MNSVDEIIQNLMEKQKLSDLEKRSNSFNENEIKAIIKRVADCEVCSVGHGAYKNVYSYQKDKVILEEGAHRAIAPFNLKRNIVSKLRDYGINTPKLIYYLTQDQAFKLGNKNLAYEVQERAKGSFLKTFDHELIITHLYGLTDELFDPELSKSSEDMLCDKYNFEMLKSRVLTGIPHTEKFLKHFTCLSAVDALDVNAGNFLYSPTFGYSFIDLDMYYLKDIDTSNLDEFFNSEINDINKNRIMARYSSLMNTCVSLFGNSVKPAPNKYFQEFIYSGILTQQFLNVMQTSHDPKLRFAKEFAQNFDKSKFYGANPQDLNLLYSAMKSNDEASLESIRQKFDLPASYDFNKELDSESFIKAMDLTNAMEQPKEAFQKADDPEMN